MKCAVAPDVVAGPGLFPVLGFHEMDGKTEKRGASSKLTRSKDQNPINSQYERFGWTQWTRWVGGRFGCRAEAGQGRHLTPALSPVEAERVKRAVAPDMVAGPGLFPVPGFHEMDGKTEKKGRIEGQGVAEGFYAFVHIFR